MMLSAGFLICRVALLSLAHRLHATDTVKDYVNSISRNFPVALSSGFVVTLVRVNSYRVICITLVVFLPSHKYLQTQPVHTYIHNIYIYFILNWNTRLAFIARYCVIRVFP
jgi:Na+/phosphate symporter